MKAKKKTKKKPRLNQNLKEAVTAAYKLGLMDGEERVLKELGHDDITESILAQ